MNEYSFCDELKEKYNIDELNSKTLTYRIDGFIYATGMDLKDSICVKEKSFTSIPYINKHYNEVDLKYDVNFIYHFDREKGRNFTLIGKYNKLNFVFVNYHTNDRRRDRINEIPFMISLAQVFGDYAYLIKMESTIGNMVNFKLAKCREEESLSRKLEFNAGVQNFGDILKLVKSFVDNPEMVFQSYSEVMSKKEIILTHNELSKGIVDDEKLDVPVTGIQKILRKITNLD